jgi:hypothetical protein
LARSRVARVGLRQHWVPVMSPFGRGEMLLRPSARGGLVPGGFRRIRRTGIIWASGRLEHPGRNLQPATHVQSAQRAAKNNAIRLRGRLVDSNSHRRPGMPRIQKLPESGPVGVLEPCSIIRYVHIRASTRNTRSRLLQPSAATSGSMKLAATVGSSLRSGFALAAQRPDGDHYETNPLVVHLSEAKRYFDQPTTSNPGSFPPQSKAVIIGPHCWKPSDR